MSARRLLVWQVGAIAALGSSFVATGCVVKDIPLKDTPGSFKVEVLSSDAPPAECGANSPLGSVACPLPFPELTAPFSLRVRATAYDRGSESREPAPMTSYNGSAIIDVRPGSLSGVGPAGKIMAFSNGVAEIDLQIEHSLGATNIWVEDCGSSNELGSFATGISPAFYFDRPTISQVQEPLLVPSGKPPPAEAFVPDNTTSSVMPQVTNVCALAGDPRYGIGTDENGESVYVGYSHGRAVNAPPPAMGLFVEVVGCTRAEYDAAVAAGGACERGPLVVTAVGNEGFYITDINPAAKARGFNFMYAFNFNYPDNLEVGDIVVSLRGAPVEFAGSTQFQNPLWKRDGVRRGADLLPTLASAHKIEPAVYQAATKTYGRNMGDNIDLEKYEDGLVCFETLAPTSRPLTCDLNNSGNMERQGCNLPEGVEELPPVCEVGMGESYMPPLCELGPMQPYCLPSPPSCDDASIDTFCLAPTGQCPTSPVNPNCRNTVTDFYGIVPEGSMTKPPVNSCALATYVPNNPLEYCCERLCYNDFSCTEESGFRIFGQWSAEVYGRYEAGTPTDVPVKVAVISREASPEFVLRYNVWCNNQQKFVEALATNKVPTTCPNDPNDTIDPSKTTVIGTLDPLQFGALQLAKPAAERQTLRIIGTLRQVLAARPVWVVIPRTPADIEINGTCPAEIP